MTTTPPPPPVLPADLQAAVKRLQGWALAWHPQHRTPCLYKAWTLPHFDAAVQRFHQIAQQAQAQDHHPEVLSSHTRLEVRIWTHDTHGLTHKDVLLAQAIDTLDGDA